MIRALGPALALAAAAAPGDDLVPSDPARTFLESDDVVRRERARRVLLARRGEALDVFARALSDDDPRRREAAVVSLGELEDDDAGDLLRGALDDDDPSVRVAAAKALALQPDGRPDELLFEAAGDRWWALRRAAALALAPVPGERAARTLGHLALDPDPDVADAALRALLLRHDPAVAPALIARLTTLDPDGEVERDPAREPGGRSARTFSGDAERAARVVRHLARFGGDDALDVLERTLVDEDAPRRLRLEAARSLARRGTPLLDRPAVAALVLRGATSGDPDLRHPAVFVLARERVAARALLLERIAAGLDGSESLAALLVTLHGADARAPLLALARDDALPTAARAAAVHGLRRFRSVDTTFELLWIYDPAQPRALRDELCAAFEDLPRTEEARSGLISALADPDSNLRLRAFRLLLAVGASTAEEIDLLWPRIQAESVDWVRRRMERLMATYASGDGARAFAHRVLERLGGPEPAAAAARATLENLGDETLRAEVGREVAERFGSGPLDDGPYRLLTRLGGPEADEVAARELRRRFDAGDPDPILRALVALRAGGGGRTLGVALRGLESDDRVVRVETFRSLFSRGVNAAFEPFVAAYDSFTSDERVELIGVARFPDPEDAARALSAVLSRESDPTVRSAIVQRAGELRAPMAGELIALVDDDTPTTLRVPVAESLAALGGDTAADVLHEWFTEAAACAAAEGLRDDDVRLWLESTARAVARTGRLDVAVPLAALLFLDAPALEASIYDTDAAFAFEVTVVQALLDLARASGRPLEVAAALEVEVDRAHQTGRIALLPKALFVGLGDALKSAPPAFDALRTQYLDLAYRLPPRTGRRELPAAARLAELATRERDHERAARYLQRSVLLIELLGIDGGRWLKETLGEAAPHAGFDPRTNLQARARMAAARARAVLGEDDDALARFLAAADLAPHDAWLQFAVASDVAAYELDAAAARALAVRARAMAPVDARLSLHAGRLLSDLGAGEAARDAVAAYEAARDVGLEPDSADGRLALAETWVRLDDPDRARRELEAARALDPARTAAHLEISPRLRAVDSDA